MKALKIFILMLVLTTGIAKAQFTKAELQVSGLTCALCAKATEKTLRTLPFITDIKPDLMRNLFVITFKTDAAVNFDQISKAVHDAGFFINTLKSTLNTDKVKVEGSSFSYGSNTFQVVNGTDKPLNGEVTLTLVDKGFAPKSVTKKYLSQPDPATAATTGRVYHAII